MKIIKIDIFIYCMKEIKNDLMIKKIILKYINII